MMLATEGLRVALATTHLPLGNFTAQRLVDTSTAPAIPQGDGNGSFGGSLADNMFVQFLDYFSGSHAGHTAQISSASITRL